MGTRSTTRVFSQWDASAEPTQLVCIYQQFDGYIEGVGHNLANFLDGMTIGNGIPHTPPERFANGPECLAAQLVSHLKDGPGGTYLAAPDASESYNYEIHAAYDSPDVRIVVNSYDGQIFEGTPAELLEFKEEID